MIKEYYEFYGLIGSIKHINEKIKWLFYQRRFKKIGKHTFVQSPYEFHGEKNISLGNYFTARSRLQMETFSAHNGVGFSPEIIIGERVSINFDVHIGAINRIVIEDDVLIASKVFITDHGHGDTTRESLRIPPQKRNLYSKGPVLIKKNAWIGEGAVILPNVTIGKNSIIGANAVVSKSIPDNCIAVGNPAKIIKRLA